MLLGLNKVKQKSKLLFVVMTMILVLILICFLIIRLNVAFSKYFVPYALNIGSDSINFTLESYYSKNCYTYNDLVNVTYNQNNQVTSLQTNDSLMNKIKADLSIYLQEEIIKNKTYNLEIPLGAVSKNIIFHSVGPKIKIKVNPLDISDLDFNEKFEEVGINQVRHKIYLDAKIKILISCYGMQEEQIIHDTIPICETVIVGEVPKYFADDKRISYLESE